MSNRQERKRIKYYRKLRKELRKFIVIDDLTEVENENPRM